MGLILTALFAHPDCTSLPSIETCLPLLDQCVHVGESEISSTTNQASPTTLYCKSLIIVALGGSPSSNHFFLIEEVKQKKFRVYDNLRGHTWIKRSEIGKKHKVYGFVLCARKRTPSTFSFDPAIYANVAKPTNDDVVKVNTGGHSKATNSQRAKGRMQIGVRLSAYRQGIAAKLSHKKKISDQHCGKSSGKRDQIGRRSQKPTKEKSCISETFHKLSLSPKEKKQSSDDVTNIHSEHVSKNRRMMLIWNAKLSRPSGSSVFLMECPRSFLSLLISLDVRPLFLLEQKMIKLFDI